MTCGIYILYFECDDGQYYVGKSVNIEGRLKQHYWELLSKRHKNKALLKGFNIYGMPTLEILEVLPYNSELLYGKEVDWIAIYDSYHNGMNETMGGSGVGYGEEHPGAKFTNNQILEVLDCLVNLPTLLFEDISELTDVSYSVIARVAQGKTHTWLASASPKLYAKMLLLNGTRSHGVSQPGERHPQALCSNTQIEEVFNTIIDNPTLTKVKISEITGISISIIYGIADGSRHKWLQDIYPEKYALMLSRKRKIKTSASLRGIVYPKLISPTNVVYSVDNLTTFSLEHNLNSIQLSLVLLGKNKVHRGWKLL